MSKYKIIIKVYGELVEEYETDSIDKAKDLYYSTFFSDECYTGLIVDGVLLRIYEAEKYLNISSKDRSRYYFNNELNLLK